MDFIELEDFQQGDQKVKSEAAPPQGWAVKKRRRLGWRTRRAQCRAIDITHVDRMPVIAPQTKPDVVLICNVPFCVCLLLHPGEIYLTPDCL